ncbi:Uncharacterised protein [Mycobacterium tuberculosis]|nr:Uncharacterised protein [Mycobacterium tuberculosis]
MVHSVALSFGVFGNMLPLNGEATYVVPDSV